MMPIFCSDLELVSFDKAYNWVKTQCETYKWEWVPIKKSREKSDPFYASLQGDRLFLKANENAKVPSTYDLTRERWDAFCAFVSANPDMRKTELAKAENIRAYGSHLLWWPAVIHISRAVKKTKVL